MNTCQWCGLPLDQGKYHESQDCKEALRKVCFHYRELEAEADRLRDELGVLRGQLEQKGLVKCWRQTHWVGSCEGTEHVGGTSQ